MDWTDNHCHLPDDMEIAAQVVLDAEQMGVRRLIDVGTSVKRSLECLKRAERFEGVWATAGVHPHDAKIGIDGLEQRSHVRPFEPLLDDVRLGGDFQQLDNLVALALGVVCELVRASREHPSSRQQQQKWDGDQQQHDGDSVLKRAR
ncbi:MAG: TatD family hydrolase, partial [Actinomycetota bacterium]|nr:TatD family hydrolase [Actinomycetota bacterium]